MHHAVRGPLNNKFVRLPFHFNVIDDLFRALQLHHRFLGMLLKIVGRELTTKDEHAFVKVACNLPELQITTAPETLAGRLGYGGTVGPAISRSM
jgi:hypothetical protein